MVGGRVWRRGLWRSLANLLAICWLFLIRDLMIRVMCGR